VCRETVGFDCGKGYRVSHPRTLAIVPLAEKGVDRRASREIAPQRHQSCLAAFHFPKVSVTRLSR
jgi:hypothetical protein